jgi:hypothetical protein
MVIPCAWWENSSTSDRQDAKIRRFIDANTIDLSCEKVALLTSSNQN